MQRLLSNNLVSRVCTGSVYEHKTGHKKAAMVISPGRSRAARVLSYMQMNVVDLLISSLYLSPKLILICTLQNRIMGVSVAMCRAKNLTFEML